MKQRGRQSAEGENAVQGLKPEPPGHLAEVAAELWREILEEQDIKRALLPILEAYCSAFARYRAFEARIELVLKQSEDGQGTDYEGLSTYQALLTKEAMLMNSCAIKLGITADKRAPKGARGAGGPKPWEQT